MELKKTFCMLLAAGCVSPLWAQRAEVKVTNTTSLQRQQLVQLRLDDVKKAVGHEPGQGETYIVSNGHGQQVGSQLTHDGLLLIDATVRPSGTATYYISVGRPAPQKVWTTGALYTLRKDDIAWENDRCCYRVYGPALQRTGERSFGTDIWVKNTPDTVVYRRYIDDLNGNLQESRLTDRHQRDSVDRATSFHLDHGNGLDPYRVGATLGLGAPALMVGDSLCLPYCYKEYEILDNGPLRFTVQLTYNPSTIDRSKQVVEHRLISLDKGSNFNRMTVWYDGLKQSVDLAMGFPVHEEDTVTTTLASDFVSYADPTDDVERNNAQVYVGVLFPEGVATTRFAPFREHHDGAVGHLLGIQKGLRAGQKYTYCFGAAWSQYDVRSYDEWLLRIRHYLEMEKTPLQVMLTPRG